MNKKIIKELKSKNINSEEIQEEMEKIEKYLKALQKKSKINLDMPLKEFIMARR